MLDSLYFNKGQVHKLKAAFVSFDFFHLHIKESLDSLFPKKGQCVAACFEHD